MERLIGYKIKSYFGTEHTYVKSTDGYSWRCFGREKGGKEICSGMGSSSIANCLSMPFETAGIIYAVTGVCHQASNRILFPAGVTVSKARGYRLSVFMYGHYGTDASWWAKVYACTLLPVKDKTAKSAFSSEANARKMELTTEDKREKDYLERIMALYIEKGKKFETFDFIARRDDKSHLLGKELEVMLDFRLGSGFDPSNTKAILNLQTDLFNEKQELDRSFYGRKFHAEQYAKKVNNLLNEKLKQSVAILGNADYEKLFGLSPKESFMIVNPKIAAKVYKR